MDDELDDGPITEDDSLADQAMELSAAQSAIGEDDDDNSAPDYEDEDDEESDDSDAEGEDDEDGSSEEASSSESSDGSSETSQDKSEDDEDDEDDEDAKGKKAAQQRKSKLKNDSKKNLSDKIKKIFANLGTTIPQDIEKATNETTKSIKDTAKKIKQDDLLKRKDKAETIASVSRGNTVEGTKVIAQESIKKLGRELIKNTAPISLIVIGCILAVFAILLFLQLLLGVLGAGGIGSGVNEPENMTSNYSITSDCFSGIRTAYIDADVLTSALQQNYKQYVSDVIVEIEKNSIDITISTITINAETKQPNPLDEGSNTYYNALALAIGNTVANKSETSFNSFLYNSIPYFGLTSAQQSTVNSLIVNYIKDNSLYTSSQSFPNNIEDQLNTSSALSYIRNCCQKVMIKDYISDENGLKNVEQLIYVGSVYMPNKDIVITDLSTAVTTTTPDKPVTAEVVAKIGQQTLITKSGTTYSTDGKLVIDTVDNSKLELPAFTGTLSDTQAFANGVSLFEALRLISPTGDSTLYSQYFQQQTIDGALVYTWMPTCQNVLYITFKSESKFIFSDILFNLAKTQ